MSPGGARSAGIDLSIDRWLIVSLMEINVSGQQRVFLFRGPGCRRAMFEWWRDHLRRAEAGEDCSIRVWGTVGNKTDLVLEWARE